MKKENGLTTIALSIIIVILVIATGIAFKIILGDDGIVKKANIEEVEYNKSEVLEELNLIITEKYVASYKKATKDGKNNLEQFYNTEKVIQYLKGYSGGENGDDYTTQDSKIIIEDLIGKTDMYFIKVSELNKDIINYGKGENVENSKDFFYIKKESEDVYNVFYKNVEGKDEEIGNLQLKPEI